MYNFSFEQMAAISIAFQRYEAKCNGVVANLALFLGEMYDDKCEIELGNKSNPHHVEYLHLRLPQYIGTIGNHANPPRHEPFEPFLWFDHATPTSNRRNVQSITNYDGFGAYTATMIRCFGVPSHKASVPFIPLLRERAKWREILRPYNG